MADDIEMWFERGVTDGLPVVPLTRERVERMLAGTFRGATSRSRGFPPTTGWGGCRGNGRAVLRAIVPGWMGVEMGSRPVTLAIDEAEGER